MADLRAVLDELVAERFGPPPLRPAPTPSVGAGDGPAGLAERQRILCEALDGPTLFVVQGRRSA